MLNLLRVLLEVKEIKIVRVTKIAVNMEQIIPLLNVTANPLIGPDPIQAKTKAAIKVVRLASRIVIKARS